MKKINYKSDFVLRLTFNREWTGDFKVVVYTDGKIKIEASRKDGVLSDNCKVVDDTIGIVCKNHGLGIGVVRTEFYVWYNNEWADGLQLVKPQREDIMLCTGAGSDDDTEVDVNVDAIPPAGDSTQAPKIDRIAELSNSLNSVRDDIATLSSAIGNITNQLESI